MASRLVVIQYISVDGVIEDPVGMEDSGLGNWTGPFTRGPEGDAFQKYQLFAGAALLLGRVTYDGFAAVWPAVKDEAGFGDYINAMPKYVATRTLKVASWNNTHIIADNLVARIKVIKSEAKGNIIVYGSASLIPPLSEAGLIDEYALMIYPVVLGRGKKLFEKGTQSKLKLIESRTFEQDISLLRFAVKHS